MRRFKTVEELNMEVTVEPTVEEKTQAFKAWDLKWCISLSIMICEMQRDTVKRMVFLMMYCLMLLKSLSRSSQRYVR